MGFLDSLSADVEGQEGGPSYVTGDEKEDIISNSIPFTISAVEVRESPFEKGTEQYVLTVQLAGEDRLMTFNKGAGSRDRSLQPLVEGDELKAGPVGPVTLAKSRTKNNRDYITFAAV